MCVFVSFLLIFFFPFLKIKKEKILCEGLFSTCRTSASKESWANLEGTFSLSTLPQRVIFYLEGPSPGVDILIKSVVITCTSPKETEVIIRA